MKHSIPISVVMPCYNQGKYVSEAINSIMQQSFQNFEFIIINDGSVDNSNEEITKIKDNKIRYIRLEVNKGNYAARNFGLKIAKGKYICVMDADDIAYPKRLETQYNYLENHRKTAAIGSCGELIDENGELIGRRLIKPTGSWSQLRTFLLMDNFVIHSSLMFRSWLVKKYNLFYNEKYRYSSDFDFISRCAALFPLRNMENILIKYRLHEMQISTKNRDRQIQYADQIRTVQVKNFNVHLTKHELEVYLKLMKRLRLETSDQLESGLHIFNKILDRNSALKLYSQKFLYQLFDYVLSLAQEKLIAMPNN